MCKARLSATVLVLTILAIITGSAWGQGQKPMPQQHEAAGMQTKPPAPIRTTMEALHAQGGVPKGWRFLMPPGDAAGGRAAFVAMKCFTCHEIKGEEFPQADKKPGDVGPELTGMGQHHPAEYFAESIVNPNRVIVQGPGYTSADGSSKMPEYADSMTVRQFIDLVAYLGSLKGGAMQMHGHGDAAMRGSGTMMHGRDTAPGTSGAEGPGTKAKDQPMNMPGHQMNK